MSTYTTVLYRIRKCLKLIPNVLSVYKRTCRIFHTSAYVGAIRRSVTGPLRELKNISDAT